MIDSYFFVPGDKEKFLEKSRTLSFDYIVLDMEDAVSEKNKELAYKNALNYSVGSNAYVRIPFLDNVYSKEQIKKLVEHFEGRILIPKVSTVNEFDEILKDINYKKSWQSILLVESPSCLVNLKEILTKHQDNLVGLTFGSHDFSSMMGMRHNPEYLQYFKQEIILISKAFGKKYIDGVDINLSDFNNFREECLWAYENGADGKFLIHPNQLEELKKVTYLSAEEQTEIKKVFQEIQKYAINEIDILKIEGKIYEKPHIKRIISLANKIEKYENELNG